MLGHMILRLHHGTFILSGDTTATRVPILGIPTLDPAVAPPTVPYS